MRALRIILYIIFLLKSSLLFSQATVQHWMLGAQGSSHETSSDFRVYQSIGQVTVTNTGTSKDFIQQGFQQSNWSTLIAQNADTFSAQIYPNPFTDVVSIKFTSSPGKTVVFEIYDLQPFGFQSEQRNYWDVPEIYNGMSPFMNAHKMKTPMLLVHGEADNNPGTFTLQTERYFQALKNLGAPVRMVILPKEAHGYAAKENIMHLLWEQDQFLEKCFKK